MIKKIIVSLFFICMFIALSIKLIQPSITYVELGKPFMSFLTNCSIELENFKIEIPTISTIPYIDNLNGFELLINAFITFANGLSAVINFIIIGLNTVIQLLQFIFVVLKNLITFRDTLIINAM